MATNNNFSATAIRHCGVEFLVVFITRGTIDCCDVVSEMNSVQGFKWNLKKILSSLESSGVWLIHQYTL